MRRWVYLSYRLDAKTPSYGGGETFRIDEVRSMRNGDTCNSARWSFPNHIGTHLDFPKHFVPDGRSFNDYPADFWIFRSVYMRDISPVRPGCVIGIEDLDIDSMPYDAEMLILKTGFGEFRNRQEYWEMNPVFEPEIADVLRQRCPKLRIMGFDTISLSSWTARETGRNAHISFLSGPDPILLLEDMDLSTVRKETFFKFIFVSPFSVSDADASPCTVLAEVEI